MSQKMARRRYTFKDHLTAYLVLLVIVCVMLLGAAGLYMTGVFDPIEVTTPALASAKPLELPTMPPRSLLDWLFPSAAAEDLPADEAPAEEGAVQEPVVDERTTEQRMDEVLAELAAEDKGERDIPEEERITVEKGDLALNENLPEDVYNVLLLATDSRDVNANSGRSDVMIVASLNKVTGEIKLASLSRDLYITIPGGSSDKLNSAYAYGGPLLAMKTVNNTFELNIQDYAVVNFAMMASIVDALGGVEIYLEPEEYYWINYGVALGEDHEGFAKSAARQSLKAGTHEEAVVHLDGLQAVSYARIRKMDNDFQRGSRQRILLQAMLNKGMANPSFSTFYSLAMTIMNSLSTNVKLTTVIELGKWLLEMDGLSMDEMSIPIQGSYHSAEEKGMSVISFNQKQNTEALHTFLYGEYIPAK